MRLARVIGGLGLAAALLAPATAHGDIFAAVGVQPAVRGPNGDIAVVNVSTGARVPFPAGINTAADELHPSISEDGTQLVFERRDPTAGTVRIIVTDLSTGQSADLFNGFEMASNPASSPSLVASGGAVATGGPFPSDQRGHFAQVVFTALNASLSGPFVHSSLRTPYGFAGADGSTDDSSTGDLLTVFGETHTGSRGELILRDPVGTAPPGTVTPPLASPSHSFSHPALATKEFPSVILFADRLVNADGQLLPGNIGFRPAATSSFLGTPTLLPPIVNSSDDESLPAFTRDERYVGFVRHSGTHDHLFVWDSQTQTLLNPAGIDLGLTSTGVDGNLSLYSKPILSLATVRIGGTVTGQVLQPSGIGLFVQRIVGRTRVLGHRAFRLRTVGRVPLGRFKRGRLRRHWDFKVNGRRLKPARYLVTVRAVTAKAKVRELGKPKLLRIRRR